MVNYPIGIQTFDKIRQGGYLYIDKTKYIYEITHPGQYVFLSRPRRFGKSLLMSTFDSYFRGRKDLFKGLAIEKLEKDWTEYPVLHFDLSDIKKGTVEDFGENVNSSLASMEGEFGIAKTSDNPGTRLKDLVERIYNKTGKQVVLLFDEYDAPLLTVLHDPERLETMRTELQSFYSPIKKLDPYLRFVFITGITKFSQLSIFSQLNNLNNISMLPQYAAMCGITIKELEDNFQEGIAVLAEKYHYSHKQVIDKLLYHYDGYHFAEDSEGVLNPFSLLSAMNNRKFNNYWFSTGTPTFLVNMMRKFHTDLTEIDGSKAMQEDFDAPTENMHNVLPLFYQSGYLTIKDYNPRSGMYTLGYPNEEVKVGLMRILIPFYVQSDPVPASNACWDISEALMDGDIDKALAAARSYFASIPTKRTR